MTAEDRVAVRNSGGCEIVELGGDVDHANAEQVERDVLSATRAADGVVIDLTAVTFLDSAGLRCLDRLVTAFRNRKAPVRVVAAQGSVVRFTLELIDFLPELLSATVDEAVSDLTG